MKTSRLASAALVAVLGASLVSCGNDSKPAVCGDVDNVQASVQELKSVSLSDTTVDQVKDDLTTLQQNVSDLEKSAADQFGTQAGQVKTALTALQSAVEAAVKNPGADTIAAIGAALSTLSTSVQTLVSDVKSTC